MKNVKVLYIRNNLFDRAGYPSTLQTLGELLKNEEFIVTTTFNKLNVMTRMLDMVYAIFEHQKTTDVVLIDSYRTLNFYDGYACSNMLRFFNKPYIPILHGSNLPNRLKNSAIFLKVSFQMPM